MNIFRWLNYEKARYYIVEVQKDGTNFILNYTWGGCNSNRGGKKNVTVNSFRQAEENIKKLLKRRKSRGYQLITP